MKIKTIFIIIVVIMFVSFFAYNIFMDYQARNNFFDENYKGTIKEIKYTEGKRGLPDVKLDNKWYYFGMNEAKVKHYIAIGDSVVKESGTKTITVYRKNENEKWNAKIFR